MTKYLLRQTKTETLIELSGHAGAAPKGYDIVCAGISTLCYFTYNLIDRLKFKYEILDIEISEGFFRLQVNNSDRYLNAIVDNLIDSMDGLWEDYPDFIKKVN